MASEPQLAQPKPLDTADMNLSARPGDDFYEYANGGWIKSHPVPQTKSSYDNYVALVDRNTALLHMLVEKAANNTTLKEGSNLKKIADLYAMGMDTATIERQGTGSIREELDLIDNISRPEDVQSVSTHMLKMAINPLFFFYADADKKNSKMMIATLSQGGLGLPERDYYFRQDNESARTRELYRHHIYNYSILLGESPEKAEQDSRTVMRMETRLANASSTSVDNRDEEKTYNKMSIQELQSFAPGIDWEQFASDLGRPDMKEIVIRNPAFVKELSSMVQDENASDWKVFLRWKLIAATAYYLSSDFEREAFDYPNMKLYGQKQIEPRWKLITTRLSLAFGEAMGRAYVEEYFDQKSKSRMQEMAANLKVALKYRIQNLTWMDNSTKAKALEKLDAMQIEVGYPDKWRDYSGLEIKNDSYVMNTFRGKSFEFYHGNYGVDKIGKPVDRTAWDYLAWDANAGSNPQTNVIFFPAGILQPPFFNEDADDAVNYGAIGSVIGHEMIHGFDDRGSKYDANGNMTDWWTRNDSQRFNESTQALVEEYNEFEALPGLYIKGNLTIGENIADLAGLALAYDAYRLSQRSEPEKIDGLTGDQRFFLSFAQSFRQSVTDEKLRTQVLTDPHSPRRFRVDGVVYNVPEFYMAFPEVRPGDRMNRPEDERIVIW
ncbi:MAG TPA: M13 family metallopeptidase [Methanotrichaceae archaeon]|nr:M13 family metallopeptidase [Methanotrichaceae archaeon]